MKQNGSVINITHPLRQVLGEKLEAAALGFGLVMNPLTDVV